MALHNEEGKSGLKNLHLAIFFSQFLPLRPHTLLIMKSVLPVILRVILVFAVACGLQYLIPWYLLAPAGVVAGFFSLKTGSDRPMALGLLIGSILFAIFAYAMAQIYPVSG